MTVQSRAKMLGLSVVVLVAFLLPVRSAWSFGGDEATKPDKPHTYDEKADAKADIAAALVKAKKDNKRVLLMFGANWCGWCHKLHGVFESNREIGRTLLYEYERVNIDIGKMDKNMDLVRKYGARADKEGVPFLTVLDADGKAIANQETGALEEGDHHDPAKVKAFLDKWKAEPLDARRVFERALSQAGKQDKKVFLSFGAPWCGWCRRLEKFLARKEIAQVMGKDFVSLKIDVDRMTGADEIVKRFNPSEGGGLPWIVLVDAKGGSLITSFGPKGNVGYPVEPFEIAHFVDMLKKTKTHMTDDDIRKVEQTLQKVAEDLRQG